MTSMPDWLHFDDVWRTMNLRLLEERDDALALLAFAQEELARLDHKVYAMRRAGWEEVPAEWRRPDLDAREKAALARFAALFRPGSTGAQE